MDDDSSSESSAGGSLPSRRSLASQQQQHSRHASVAADQASYLRRFPSDSVLSPRSPARGGLEDAQAVGSLGVGSWHTTGVGSWHTAPSVGQSSWQHPSRRQSAASGATGGVATPTTMSLKGSSSFKLPVDSWSNAGGQAPFKWPGEPEQPTGGTADGGGRRGEELAEIRSRDESVALLQRLKASLRQHDRLVFSGQAHEASPRPPQAAAPKSISSSPSSPGAMRPGPGPGLSPDSAAGASPAGSHASPAASGGGEELAALRRLMSTLESHERLLASLSSPPKELLGSSTPRSGGGDPLGAARSDRLGPGQTGPAAPGHGLGVIGKTAK